ncbi:hypothetical protein CJD36_003060 [Flavipsychrobacter stenotrophus]|uniref:DUF2252 domain-containing protein n=1 Tax=Flavipsychrobacter stenotrophus TaxID=2077091 RepID=A0A2S7T0M9_9BACT|nr:DUF2252 family protein [Flavipsychrobacter stenotrophus]PQJ12742.1 hypothetical protein CJD36_003060 [Flavipsychrobacter stenotrophus]
MSLIKRLDRYNMGVPEQLHQFKWKALQESPFRFYRGTCHLFAEDFAKLYKNKPKIRTWTCGDAHFENFGSYKGDNRQVYFDINDFDEAFLGSPETELTRFITSIIVAAAQMNVAHVKVHKAIHDILDTYTATIAKRKAMMLESEVAYGEFKKYFGQMSTMNRDAFIAKRTVKEKGVLKLKTDGKRYLPMDKDRKIALFESITPLLTKSPKYSQMVFEDAAIRIAGTGSLGQNRYCMLFFSKAKGKQYLIDVKESRPSCYLESTTIKQPRFKNDAERIITTGNLMQFTPPAFIVPHKMADNWYVVKELQPSSDRMSLEYFDQDFSRLSEVAKEMARLLAYAHLRSSGNFTASTTDELVKFAKKQQWQRDILDLSGTLAIKNQKYYKMFCDRQAVSR